MIDSVVRAAAGELSSFALAPSSLQVPLALLRVHRASRCGVLRSREVHYVGLSVGGNPGGYSRCRGPRNDESAGADVRPQEKCTRNDVESAAGADVRPQCVRLRPHGRPSPQPSSCPRSCFGGCEAAVVRDDSPRTTDDGRLSAGCTATGTTDDSPRGARPQS